MHGHHLGKDIRRKIPFVRVLRQIVHASKDEAIIILSSFSPEDMVAVRRVMQLYEGSDTLFVLVNCKLNPIPRELLRSEVVYSLLPLTVRERASQSTLMNKQQQNQENDYDNTIKVIVHYC